MTAPDNRADISVVSVNGASFVTGLYWMPLKSVRNPMAEAKKIGKDQGMQMVAIRQGRTVIQAGFAPKSKRKLKGMYSLAAALAGVLGDNWIGVFELGSDRYALIAVHDGAVLPGRDTIGTRDQVENLFRQTYSLVASDANGHFNKQGKTIAPADFEAGAEHLSLEDLLPATALKKSYRLRPLTLGLTPNEIALGVLAVATVAGLAYGAWWWMGKRAEDQRQANLVAAQQAQNAAVAEAAASLPRPWVTTPQAGDVLQACSAFWSDTPLVLGGWRFEGGKCAPGQAMAAYRRNDGAPVSAFAAAAQTHSGSAPSIYDQGNAGSISAVIEVQPAAQPEELPPAREQLEAFTSYFQRLGPNAPFSITEKPFVPSPDNPEAPAPDWITNGFQITSPLPPHLLLERIDARGLRVFEASVSLDSSTATLTWTVTGEMYGR